MSIDQCKVYMVLFQNTDFMLSNYISICFAIQLLIV